MEVIIGYHDRCFDGYGARYVFQKHFGNSAKYMPMSYSSNKYDTKLDAIPDRSFIIFADYCPAYLNLEDLKKRNCMVLILDHHETALKIVSDYMSMETFLKENRVKIDPMGLLKYTMKLADLITSSPKSHEGLVLTVFDMKRSGAGICHDFIVGDSLVRKFSFERNLFSYLEDRDLWKWELQDSKLVNEYIQCHPWTFDSYRLLESELKNLPVGDIAKRGVQIQKATNKTVSTITEDTIKIVKNVNDGEALRTIAFFNTTSHWSEVGQEVLNKYPEVDISCGLTFNFLKHEVMFSLRSRQTGDIKCSVLGTSLGGGGHANAAGAVHKIGNAMEWLKSVGAI